MTVSYNLIYWNNCHGRGEVTRLLFTYARQAFEEATFTNEEWPALKAQQPYGQLPVLEVDGVKIAQSRAIERFLARRFNLVGKNDIERAINDQIICGIDDTRQHFAKMFNEDDTLKSEAEVKAIIDEHVVSFLERHDKFLAINRHNHFVAEVSRLLFTLGGAKFEDFRYSFAEWPQHKASTPLFQQLPLLEFEENGKKHILAQSRAIEIFLATRFHLMGKDDIENAEIAQYILGIDDLLAQFKPAILEQDEEKKKVLMGGIIKDHVLPTLHRYNTFINEQGHLVGNKLTLADVALFHITWLVSHKFGVTIPAEATKLNKLYQQVESEPKIKAYIQSRKDSKF
uniref:Glutathione S-transferase n=1 Tax=Rhabditophanes sp. KR3021 TaxID=114890 RepID=A0AC35TGB8_9BILA